jgi:hypothetical protein
MNPILTQLLADAHVSDMRAEAAVARRARQARRARRGPIVVISPVRVAGGQLPVSRAGLAQSA